MQTYEQMISKLKETITALDDSLLALVGLRTAGEQSAAKDAFATHMATLKDIHSVLATAKTVDADGTEVSDETATDTNAGTTADETTSSETQTDESTDATDAGNVSESDGSESTPSKPSGVTTSAS